MFVPVDVDSPDAAAERALRLEVWSELVALGVDVVPVAKIHDLGIYAGQAGVYADKSRTSALTSDGAGVAVSVVHRGTSYADDLSADGLLYHYPKTNRSAAHDAGEVQALKWTQILELPIFAITPSSQSASARSVHLSWVTDYDDASGLALISFGDAPPAATTLDGSEPPFFLTATADERRALRKIRVGQQRFSFEVFRRYGAACVACGLTLPELLDAAHICAAGEGGSNDARNGLPLCALHHRAYDRGYWAIDPTDGMLVARSGGPTLEELRITLPSVDHLPARPHPAAVAHAWAQFSRRR